MHSADLKTSTSARTIKLDDGPLRIEDIIDIAEEGSARVVLSDSHEFCAGIARGADFLDRLLREEGTIYGVTTGYGDSCTVTVPLELVASCRAIFTPITAVGWGSICPTGVGCGCRKRRTIV